MILGSRNEVERIVRYHAEHDRGFDRRYSSPLFNERSLFRLVRDDSALNGSSIRPLHTEKSKRA